MTNDRFGVEVVDESDEAESSMTSRSLIIDDIRLIELSGRSVLVVFRTNFIPEDLNGFDSAESGEELKKIPLAYFLGQTADKYATILRSRNSRRSSRIGLLDEDFLAFDEVWRRPEDGVDDFLSDHEEAESSRPVGHFALLQEAAEDGTELEEIFP